MRALCEAPKPNVGPTPEASPPPPAIAEVIGQVERVRELRYRQTPVVDPVTQAEIDDGVREDFERTVPDSFYRRRTSAWRAIGVIPPDADIRESLLRFSTGQVVGYYDPATKELVYIGDAELDLTERYVLAHELTHALDDQHFDLTRLDPIAARCDDEAFMAGLGAVEGSAQFFATQVLIRFPSGGLGDLIGASGDAPSLQGVPPFITNLELWPYTAGMAFISTLDIRGGTQAVNQALRDLPVSTEQVIHPERYPNDVPHRVDVPDLAPRLGPGWRDLDVMLVGEAWLQIMLELRLDDAESAIAASGWDGGLYRAWSSGDRSAVVLSTVWDTAEDAQEFADVIADWFNDQEAEVLEPDGTRVTAIFASDGATLDTLRGAVAA
jgi:hypothetical protein